jgi:hypothetical protein
MNTHEPAVADTSPTLAPTLAESEETVQVIFRMPKSEHAAFKSKCALQSTSMQGFLKAKVAEFMEAQ